MKKDIYKLLEEYIRKINKTYQSEKAREKSYRADLKNLIEEFIGSKITIVEDGKRDEFGTPDYKIIKGGADISFLETKDICDNDLFGEAHNKAQFDKYKQAIATIAFTNYLTFILYNFEEEKLSACIGKIVDGEIVLNDDEEEITKFTNIMHELGSSHPQGITTSDKLVNIMARKAKVIKNNIKSALEISEQEQSKEDDNLHQYLNGLKKILVHDMTEEQFADFYAQTITYAMFIARYNDTDPENFSLLEVKERIPEDNPFLKKIFSLIAIVEVHPSIKNVVDDLVMVFRYTDMKKVMKNYGNGTGRKDPILNFYEDFLAEYNPKFREDFGVYYTPIQVVQYIINSVDKLLREEFHIEKGLADNSMIPDRGVHKVQILDPATGTGTFLAEICEKIYSSYKNNEGMWANDVVEHIVPRLNGFEYLMAPYTMAHLKLTTSLRLDKIEKKPERLNIFLTNSLEEGNPMPSLPFATYITDEANAANVIKNDSPVMVIVGNPPYREKSANNGDWIMEMMHDYKQEPGKKKEVETSLRGKVTITDSLQEANSKGINNDYCKFIRLGQRFVEKNQEGVLAFITANTYLDTRLFRGMRYNLLTTFDKIYILNLHGSNKRKENVEGRKDENVFDIEPGVAIAIFIRKKGHDSQQIAQVLYKDLFGRRSEKLEFLQTHVVRDSEFEMVNPEAPLYKMTPISENIKDDYEQVKASYYDGFKISEFMPEGKVQGFKTGKDKIAIQKTKAEMTTIFSEIENNSKDIQQIISQHNVISQKAESTIRSLRSCIRISGFNGLNKLAEVCYRPFDNQWTIFDKLFIDRQRPEIEKNILWKKNIVLGLGQQGNVMGDAEWCLTYISDKPMDTNVVPRGGIYLFPMYIYEADHAITNFNEVILKHLEDSVGLSIQANTDTQRIEGGFLPEDVIDYIYAVLFSHEYRTRYHEFLQSDFPVIPYPQDAEYFFAMAEKGKILREVHLMKNIPETGPAIGLRGLTGDLNVEMHKFKDGCVYINKDKYFDGITQEEFNYFISGYQVADKWLKDRLHHQLSSDEVENYKKAIYGIRETMRIQNEIDEIIRL